ncbi:MAG TPA: isochorismate synthase [Polyangiaceae bacterium]|nr:isochorismate synthase [Polyangiaceae bacterium]
MTESIAQPRQGERGGVVPISGPTSEETLQALRQDLRQLSSRWAVARAPAPRGLARRLLETPIGCAVGWNPGGHANAGEPDQGTAFIGLDAVATFRAEGPERLPRLREELERFTAESPELLGIPGLRAFGGVSFEPQVEGDWSVFGAGLLVLPRLLYVDRSDRAELLLLTPPHEVESSLAFAESALRGAVEQRSAVEQSGASSQSAAGESGGSEPSQTRVRSESTSLDRAGFCELVERIRAGIERGDFTKVVAARSLHLELTEAPRLAEFLARLREVEPSAARFLLRLGDSRFVGATPERLVRKRGLQVETEAVAGSISTQLEGAGERLLGSTKDQAEHRVVVAAIREALAELVAWEPNGEPRLRALRRILHLHTPLTGELHEARHVLDLVERLHPTPAVGGHPRQAALAFLRANEPGSRGWYAAPFGWVDLHGDGEFVVALRSALLHGERAQVFAGAGIVRDSRGEDEYAETELKMSAMLAALGLRS